MIFWFIYLIGWFYDIIGKLFGFRYRELRTPPNWVVKATNKAEYKYLKKYGFIGNKRFYFRGKRKLYKVIFEPIEQGRWEVHYFMKFK